MAAVISIEQNPITNFIYGAKLYAPAFNCNAPLVRLLPKVYWPFRLGTERHRHFLSAACRLISREDRLQNRPAVLAGNQRFFIVLHAIHKMRDLLRKAV